MQKNIEILKKQNPDSFSLKRYKNIGSLLSGRPDADSMDGVDIIKDLIHKFNLPGLSEYGLSKKKFDDLIDKSMRASSMKGNPVQLTRKDVEDILTNAA
jgi:alcohol dehydrogenase class IV